MHSKERDEVCLSFLEEIFTKSVHRGGVNNFINYYVLSDWQILEYFEALIKMNKVPCHAYYERVYTRSNSDCETL